MAKFTVLSQVDAFVDYVAEVEAETAQAAVDLVYDGSALVAWAKRGTVEFDARHMVALDGRGEEIEATARGDFG